MKTLKIYKYISFLMLLAISSLTVSCHIDQEANDDYSTIVPSSPVISVTFSEEIPSSMVEEDKEFPFTISLSEAQVVDVKVNIAQIGGSATEDADFSLSDHSLTIPAFTTSVSGSIMVIGDTAAEGPEDVIIQIGDNQTANASLTPVQVSFTLENYVSDDLHMSFEWDTLIDGYHTADYVDLDIFVADGNGYDNNDPWATWIYMGYPAATGNHPEEITMNINDWADGDYVLFHDLWDNAFVGYPPAEGVMVPITATFTRAGVFQTSVTQDSSQAINAFTSAGGNGFIAKVTIANGEFIISDYNDNVIDSGKMSAKPAKRPADVTAHKSSL